MVNAVTKNIKTPVTSVTILMLVLKLGKIGQQMRLTNVVLIQLGPGKTKGISVIFVIVMKLMGTKKRWMSVGIVIMVKQLKCHLRMCLLLQGKIG